VYNYQVWESAFSRTRRELHAHGHAERLGIAEKMEQI
jgi:hypothetical protein